MGATPLNFSNTTIQIGPGNVFLDVAVPGAGARLALDSATGRPDATANPNAVHLGNTEAGSKLTYKPTLTEFESDESTAPIYSSLTVEDARIEGNWLQVADIQLLAKMMIGATRVTGSGYDQVTFGGKTSVAGFSVAVIAPSIADSTKRVIFHLYNAFNEGGLDIGITRKKLSGSPFNFKGQSVTTRAQNDQIGSFWREV